jgi:hypothetical protein
MMPHPAVEAAARALAHLVHHHVAHVADAIPLVGLEWTVFHFPETNPEKPKHHKSALYGRMWKLRGQGMDAMVRQLPSGEYVLVARRFQ